MKMKKPLTDNGLPEFVCALIAQTFSLLLLISAGNTAFAQAVATQTQTAQAQTNEWTLQRCIDYAHANNLQLKQADLRIQESECSRKQCIATMFPSVNASTSLGLSRQNIRNSLNEYMSDNTFNARYNIGAGMTIFNGMRQYYDIKQQELSTHILQLDKEELQFQLDLSIIRTYTQIAYIRENIRILENNVSSSDIQLRLAEHKFQAGSLSPGELAQFAVQCSNERYQLVCGRNLLNAEVLKLKQLLELGMDDSLHIASYIPDSLLLQAPLPDKKQLYGQAQQQLPGSRSHELKIRMAELNCRMAIAGNFPSLTLTASIGSGNWFDGSESFVTQIDDNLNQSLGISLNIPIFNRLQTRTAIQKAQINRQHAELSRYAAEKELLCTIEGLYNDATAARSQYLQAKAQLEAAIAGLRLVEEQFLNGMKNTVELLLCKNDCLNAAQQLLQAKYTAALAVKLLHYYQGIPLK